MDDEIPPKDNVTPFVPRKRADGTENTFVYDPGKSFGDPAAMYKDGELVVLEPKRPDLSVKESTVNFLMSVFNRPEVKRFLRKTQLKTVPKLPENPNDRTE